MSQTCTIAIQRTASGYLFRVAGRGTLRESPAVRDFVCGAIDDGAQIIIDLSDCEYLDSTFLGCLVMMQQRGKTKDGSFRLFADQETRDRLFHTCRLDHLLQFADGLPETDGEPVRLEITELDRQEFCRHLVDAHEQLAELGGPSAETFRHIVEQLRQELNSL